MPSKPLYDCSKCPGYCCSYPLIALTKRDVTRLAEHLGLPFEVCEKRYTQPGWGHKRIFKRKKDPHYGRICRFFDTDERRCTVYEARPAVCRRYPRERRCGYYDFLAFERRAQSDPEFVALTENR